MSAHSAGRSLHQHNGTTVTPVSLQMLLMSHHALQNRRKSLIFSAGYPPTLFWVFYFQNSSLHLVTSRKIIRSGMQENKKRQKEIAFCGQLRGIDQLCDLQQKQVFNNIICLSVSDLFSSNHPICSLFNPPGLNAMTVFPPQARMNLQEATLVSTTNL